MISDVWRASNKKMAEGLTVDLSSFDLLDVFESIGVSAPDDIFRTVDEYLNVYQKDEFAHELIVEKNQLGVLKWIIERPDWSVAKYSLYLKESLLKENFEISELLLTDGFEKNKRFDESLFHFFVSRKNFGAVHSLFTRGFVTKSVVTSSLCIATSRTVIGIIIACLKNPQDQIDDFILYEFTRRGIIELIQLIIPLKKWPKHILYISLDHAYRHADANVCKELLDAGAVPDKALLTSLDTDFVFGLNGLNARTFWDLRGLVLSRIPSLERY